MADEGAEQFGKGFVATDYVPGPLPTDDTPIEDVDPSRPELFGRDLWQPVFRRLRREAPIHWVQDSAYGPYWCLSTYDPLVEVSEKPEVFSSSFRNGGFNIQDMSSDPAVAIPMFIALDDPEHAAQRRSVAPALAPTELKRLEAEVRRRTAELLDGLPRGEDFDWVDQVSIELTTGLLALLFDFPWDDRRKLTFWSDWMGDTAAALDPVRREQRGKVLFEAAAYFTQLWMTRKAAEPARDMISMMAHSDALEGADQRQILGNIMLLIVGGNDTTRNAMSGAAWFMNRFPEARAELEADSSLIGTAVTETLRMQSPLPHMRRTAMENYDLGGYKFRKGDKVVMWHISANRDESVFTDPDDWNLHRENSRRHLAFGHGIHRCVGSRLGEMQLRIMFEELAARRLRVEQTDEAGFVESNFLHGFKKLPVRLRGL
ncbi:MAG: cytochrome P450 [Sphingomonadaceae bacterium]|nr:cytochrome P450 [Sphingomonadaceae bacterium]